MLARKNKILIAVFGVVVAAAVVLGLTQKSLPLFKSDSCPESTMYTARHNVKLFPSGTKKYNLEFATTPSQQEMGLSGRACMPSNSALIFLFPTDDKFGIWMKQMRFAIDVVWLDKDRKVVSVEKNMQPNSYPKVFYPTSDARYVVELNKGDVDSSAVSLGQQLTW